MEPYLRRLRQDLRNPAWRSPLGVAAMSAARHLVYCGWISAAVPFMHKAGAYTHAERPLSVVHKSAWRSPCGVAAIPAEVHIVHRI